MAKKKVLKNYYTIQDLAKVYGKSQQLIDYHYRKNNLPSPAIRITYVRFLGDNVRPYTINLWKKSQLRFIEKRLSKIYVGLYKRLKHPITGKKVKRNINYDSRVRAR